jgi:hypothetical protein
MKWSSPLVGSSGRFLAIVPSGAVMVRSENQAPQDAGIEESVPVRELFDVLNQIKRDAAANSGEYLQVTEVPHGGE